MRSNAYAAALCAAINPTQEQPQFIVDKATGEILRPADAVPGIEMDEGCEDSLSINDVRHAGDRAYLRHLAAQNCQLALV